MSDFEVTRRGFLMGCSAAVAAMAGARFNSVVMGNPNDTGEILLTVFLRGAMDVLNFLPPIDGDNRGFYEAARPTLAVPIQSAIPLTGTAYGLHPNAAPLAELYQSNQLAIVHGTGMPNVNRSHFEAMNLIETAGGDTNDGWLTRYIDTATDIPSEALLPVVNTSNHNPKSLLQARQTVSLPNTASQFHFNHVPSWYDEQKQVLQDIYDTGDSAVHVLGQLSLGAIQTVETRLSSTYQPSVTYPDNEFGTHLKTLAQIIKEGLGLRVATVDLGGWDTHERQGHAGGGYYGNLMQTFSEGMAAFYADLRGSQVDYTKRVTVVVMSEFGRRVAENSSLGTDHGHGSVTLVLGGNVNGGLYGEPDLNPNALYQGIDLPVTTDYRHILSEIIVNRMQNDQIDTIFPNFSDYSPLGVVQPISSEPALAVDLKKTTASTTTSSRAVTAAGIGLAATSGLLALRNRRYNMSQ